MRRSGILTGLVVVFLGVTWLLQGAEVLDGRFFSNAILSVVFGIATAALGLALISWSYLRLR